MKIATDVKLQYSPTLEQQAVGPTAQHEKGRNRLIAATCDVGLDLSKSPTVIHNATFVVASTEKQKMNANAFPYPLLYEKLSRLYDQQLLDSGNEIRTKMI
jgi:hypothetical protein